MTAPSKREMEKLKQNVQQKFEQIREALSLRERLLLRQIDVIATSTQKMTRVGAGATATITTTTTAVATPVAEGDTKTPQELRLLTDNEEQLLSAIRSYGRFNLDSINLALLQDSSYMSNEDYITPSNDHETMYKCLNTEQLATAATSNTMHGEQDESNRSAAIVVDFSRNKSLIEKNVSNMNESIINITLAEAKELIRKAKTKREREAVPPLNLEELADEQESSIAEAVSSLGKLSNNKSSGKSEHTLEPIKKTKKQRFKPKITINNCNGTINLRNISNLTINCASEENVRAELPVQQGEEAAAEMGGLKQPVAESSGSATIEELCSSSTGNSTPTATTTNTGDGGGTSSNYSSNASSRKQSQKHKQSAKRATQTHQHSNDEGGVYVEDVDDDDDDDDNCDDAVAAEECNEFDDEEENAVHCEFYNRLLNEIKNSLKRKSTRYVDNAQYAVSSSTAVMDSSNCDSNSNADTSKAPPKRFVLKNFENLKIVLESNGVEAGSAEESFHPVQIEQWLAEIISETDLEPMQNTDILEHSRIHEKCKK